MCLKNLQGKYDTKGGNIALQLFALLLGRLNILEGGIICSNMRYNTSPVMIIQLTKGYIVFVFLESISLVSVTVYAVK